MDKVSLILKTATVSLMIYQGHLIRQYRQQQKYLLREVDKCHRIIDSLKDDGSFSLKFRHPPLELPPEGMAQETETLF